MPKRASLAFIPPAEPVISRVPPAGADWSHELKWDGWRVQFTKDQRDIVIRTRRGRPLELPSLATALARLRARTAIIDAELVACDDDGRCDMGELRRALARKDERRLVVRCFDLLHLDGEDLRPKALQDRQAALGRLIRQARNPRLLICEGIVGDPMVVLEFAERHRLEGIVSKRLGSPYRSGKTRAWVKIKTDHWRRTRAPEIAEAFRKRQR